MIDLTIKPYGGDGGGGGALHRPVTGVRTQVANIRNQFIPRRNQYRRRQLHEHHDDDDGDGGGGGDTLRCPATGVRTQNLEYEESIHTAEASVLSAATARAS